MARNVGEENVSPEVFGIPNISKFGMVGLEDSAHPTKRRNDESLVHHVVGGSIMSAYRRLFIPGGTYFFTVVTAMRRPILTAEPARSILRRSIEETRRRFPFEIIAMVLLPDHLHAIWSLPLDDCKYAQRWGRIKANFTREYLHVGGIEAITGKSRREKRERGIWQRRYWEHFCRDESDLQRCIDYVHWNPVKHGYVQRVKDYPWSTFFRFVSNGEYDEDRGHGKVTMPLGFAGE
jgi:putative transposase